MTEYCSLIITPDAVCRGQSENILKDILDITSARIVWRAYCRVQETAVCLLYPHKIYKPYFRSLVKCYVAGESLIVLLAGRKGLAQTVKELKGRFYVNKNGSLDVSGLRLKYGASITNRQTQDGGEEILEFRIHCSDNVDETALICALFMNDLDYSSLEDKIRSKIEKLKVRLNDNNL
ncbi:MAG: nucleoside-diphosphate kinase [Patescibacteria group bacterium]